MHPLQQIFLVDLSVIHLQKMIPLDTGTMELEINV